MVKCNRCGKTVKKKDAIFLLGTSFCEDCAEQVRRGIDPTGTIIIGVIILVIFAVALAKLYGFW